MNICWVVKAAGLIWGRTWASMQSQGLSQHRGEPWNWGGMALPEPPNLDNRTDEPLYSHPLNEGHNCRKGWVEILQLSFPLKTINHKQYYFLAETAKIYAIIKDLKEARIVIPITSSFISPVCLNYCKHN